MVYIHQNPISDGLNAFRFGLACGSASCLQEENSVVDIHDVNKIFPRITMEEIELQNM
jgi:fructose-1-phosphate kinase PfkB-like protein